MQDPSNPEARDAIKLVLIANDIEYLYWSKAEVEDVRRNFVSRRGSIPSFADLGRHFENEKLTEVLNALVVEQKDKCSLTNALQAVGSPCLSCKSETDLSHFDFGLARVEKQERDWASTGISVAISAVTLPLLGVGKLYGPAKTTTAQVLRLRLILCQSCIRDRQSLFGNFKVTEMHGKLHPMWGQCADAGFVKFIGSTELASWH